MYVTKSWKLAFLLGGMNSKVESRPFGYNVFIGWINSWGWGCVFIGYCCSNVLVACMQLEPITHLTQEMFW